MEKGFEDEMKKMEEDEESDSEGSNEEEDNDEDMEEEDEVSPETLKKISEFEEELAHNPYNYNAHLELVGLLKSTGDFLKLRAARTAFSSQYPLTSELWDDWVNDEAKIAVSEEEKKFVVELFEKGIKDYLSVELWLSYCQYALKEVGTEEGQKYARSVFERAITAGGIHVSKGGMLWAAYRDFENCLLAVLEPPPGSVPSKEQLEKQAKQKQTVASIFKRQLRIPLFGIMETFVEFKSFLQEDVDQNVERDYNKALEALKAREDYEAELLNKDNGLENYLNYIDYEKKQKDPVRIQCLFERAISSHCLEADLWVQYLAYLDTTLKIDTVSLPVYERAVRNCPWSSVIWCGYLRSLERFEKPKAEVVKVFEQALAAGFTDNSAYLEVWLAFLDFMRRGTEFSKEVTTTMSGLRTAFERATDHLARMKADPECKVLRYWANLEADHCHNVQNARNIWADINNIHGNKASFWIENITMEKQFGDRKHLRKVYLRALEKTHDTPELVADSWIQFEREEGSLESWESCREKCNKKLERIAEIRAKESEAEMEEEKRKSEKVEKKKEKDKQVRRDRRQETSIQKREVINNSSKSNGVAPPPGFKSNGGQAIAPPPGFKVPNMPPPKTAVAPPPGYVAPPPGFKPSRDDSDEPAAKKQKIDNAADDTAENADEKQERTVFLSNLSFDIDEEGIKEIMGSSGAIAEVRLAHHVTGKSKGFAFVEYESKDSAVEAIKRDNELIDGRPMYISKCDPNKKGHSFKYKLGLEKNKLFLKGLPASYTKVNIQQIFGEFGKIIDIRLVTYRNGHSKGMAFVDYEDEVSAATALLKTDGMKLEDCELHVALSNPPERKPEGGVPAADVRSLGGGQKKVGKSQVAFMPRSVAVQAKKPPVGPSKPVAFVSSSKSDSAEKNGSSNGSKSNADFRKMLLGIKPKE